MRASFRNVPLFALMGVAFAVPALAQSDLVKPGEAIPAACTDQDVTPDRNRRASDLFKTGKIAAENLEREKAIFYYLDAYRADCTGHAVLLKIAELWELKGNKAEALRYTQAFLDRAKADDPNRESATVRRDRLKRDLAAAPATSTATPTATAPTTTATGTTAPTTSGTIAPPPTATATGQGGHSVVPWVVVGIGGAALVTGGILLVVGAGKVSDSENALVPGTQIKVCNSNHQCSDPTVQASGNSGRNLETIGVIVGSVGLAAVIGGLVWHFVEPTGPKQETATGARITPQVAPGYGGLSVVGRF